MLRQAGFYYTKRSNFWGVSLYMPSLNGWSIPGLAGVFQDSDFSDIKDEPVELPK